MKNMKSYSKEILKNISLIIFSILLAIYMLEIAYSLYNISSYKHKKWTKHKRSSFDIYKEYKNSGKDIVTTVPPPFYIDWLVSRNYTNLDDQGLKLNRKNNLYQLSGISNKLTIFCNESGYWTIYKSDRYGFNNPDEVWDKLEFDFVLIGDSFVKGACVHEKDSIAGLLRRKNKILNLAYVAGPLGEYATLREYFKNIKTKNVLWFYTEDSDLIDLQSELSIEVLVDYLEDINFTQNLINKQKEIDFIASNALLQAFKEYQRKENILFRFDEFKFKNVLLLKSIRGRLSWMFKIDLMQINLINSKKDELNYLDKFSELLFQANNLVTKNNSKLYFVYLPVYPGTHDGAAYTQRSESYKKIIDLVKKLDIPIIDLYKDLFKDHPDPKSLFPDRRFGHYNEEGYRLVVETVLEKI